MYPGTASVIQLFLLYANSPTPTGVTNQHHVASMIILTKINKTEMSEIFIPLGAYAMVVAIVYLNIRKRERLALIERGLNASFFDRKTAISPSLKWGIILVFLGFGMFAARLFHSVGVFEEIDEAYLSMLLLSGGLGLLITHFFEVKARNEKNSKSSGESR